jgi:hypothetical protein
MFTRNTTVKTDQAPSLVVSRDRHLGQHGPTCEACEIARETDYVAALIAARRFAETVVGII